MFDVMEEDGENGGNLHGPTIGEVLFRSYSNGKTNCPSPNTMTSFHPELTLAMRLGDFTDICHYRPLLLPLRLQAVGNLMPTDMKCLSFNMSPNVPAQGSSPTEGKIKAVGERSEEMKEVAEESSHKESHERPNDTKATNASPNIPDLGSNMIHEIRGSAPVPPPPPPPLTNKSPSQPPTALLPQSSVPINVAAAPPKAPIPPCKGQPSLPPPPMPLTKGAAPPPPPPLGVAKALRPKKATTKLKRSTHMGSMYRLLKGKVEGTGSNEKVTNGSKTKSGASAGGQQGMADALAEMTKRSFSQTLASEK